MNESSRNSTQRTTELSIVQLQTFRQVMEQGGYAAAAKISHLSVPSVWQHVQALEKVYGVRLFDRVGRNVQPTDAAHRLYEHVDSILVQLESTFEFMEESSAKKSIRLVTGVRMMIEDLAEPLAAFQRRFPNQLTLRQGNERRAEELLLADEVDMALTLEPGPGHLSSLIHYEPAYTVEFLAVSRSGHPYSKSKSSSLAELATHSLIVTASGTHGRDALEQAFHREKLTANIVVETDNSAFTIACVTAGMGVGILAGRRRGSLCRKLTTRSLSKQLGHRQIVFMWRKGRLLSEPMLELVDVIQQIDR